MPTIGNLPAADVEVTFPSGTTKTVNVIVLKAQVLNAEAQARFGHGLTRNAPTLKAQRDMYEIPVQAARTWKAIAPLLKQFHTNLSDAIAAARAAA